MDPTLQGAQRRLIALGYDLGPAGADGKSGRMTTAAIAKFQKDRSLDIQYPGTLGPKTLAALDLEPVVQVSPPWVELAKRKMGLHEIRDNEALRAFLKSDGHALGDPAKLPWCGDFIETCIAVTLPNEPIVTNPYWALNWLKFGREIPKDKPVMGAIGASQRNGGGHVFFVVGHDKTHYHCLGGNQSNSVSIVKKAKKEVAGLRYPSTYPMPSEPLGFSVFNGPTSASEA
jgi:uncharacterized protein (TIGR02594 family)